MIKIVFTLVLLAMSFTEANAQSCQSICAQYYAYARNAGAMGTYGPLVNLYNRCMACQRGGTRRRTAVCPQGKMRSGRYCITRGHRICPSGKHSCPAGQQCAANGCLPKGASSCSSGKGFCKAPLVCAVNLDGKEGCFTREDFKRLETVKRKQKRRLAHERKTQRIRAEQAKFKAKYGEKYETWLGARQQEMANIEIKRIREIADRNPRVRKAYQEMLRAEIDAARTEGKVIDEKRRLLLQAEAVVRGADIAASTASSAVPGGSFTYSGSQLLTDYTLGQKSGATATGDFVGVVAGGVWVENLGIPAAAPIAKAARAATYLTGETYRLEKNRTR